MSEAAATEKPKKKGKLPIIIVAVLVLGGGGYMKMKGGGKPVIPPVELGEAASIVEIKDEFLVNLSGGNNYMKAKISLLPKKGAKKEEIEHLMPILVDTIYTRLRRTSLAMLNGPDGVPLLKRQLAQDLNWQLEQFEHKPAPAPEPEKKKKKGKHDEEEKPEGEERPEEITKMPAPDEMEHPDWDSDEGPILKVLFTSIATQ